LTPRQWRRRCARWPASCARRAKLDRALAVWRVLGASAEAQPDDGYALAALELAAGRRDQAFLIFASWSTTGTDVAAAVRGIARWTPSSAIRSAFIFADRRPPAGRRGADRPGGGAGATKQDKKIGQMARAKLKSAGFSE